MKNARHNVLRAGSPSFALVSVLALVSLAALSATAFLAAARLERLASRPLADLTRLEMASGTGLAMAMGVLAQAGSTNYGLQRIVTYWRTNEADDLGYLLLGIFTNPANSLEVSYLPAFSSSLMISNALDPASTQTNASRVTGQGNYRANAFAGAWTNGLNTTNSTNFPLLGNQTSPLVAWIPIRQERRIRPGSAATTNVQVARMAFFVQDLQGLIDAERMGGSNNRTTGTNPAEISLTNLSGTALINATTASTFVATNTRRLFASVGMLTLSNVGGLATNDLRYVATGLRSWGWAQNDAGSFSNRIPPGIQLTATSGYSTNAGQVKLDLNTNLTAASLDNLVTLLSNNLPNFTNRAGGFAISAAGGATNTNAYTGTAYLQTLAANIIDYADADSDPTTDGTTLTTNRVRPVYRGVDSYPFITEINKRYLLLSNNVTNEAGTPGRMAVVATTDFIEVWNPSSQTVPAGTLVFVSAHRQPVTFGFLSASFATPTRASNSLGAVSNGVTTNTFPALTLLPNEFRALACPTVTNWFFVASTNTATFSMQDERTNSHFFATWNGRFCDAGLGGISRNAGNLAVGTPANRSQMPGFIYRTLGGFADPAVGDPRATIYLSRILDANAYSGNSTFGGRNRRAGSVAPGQPFYEVAPATWPDGGHNSPPGNPAGSDNTLPTAVTPATYSNVPPGRISNAGSFSNIFELGAIFDPMQWRDPGLGAWQGKYTNLSTAGVADNGYGGGNTLRIGRPEHPRFAFTNYGGGDPVPNMGMSAAAMLDLFRVGSADSNSFTGGGKINLNTAPRPVLAALAGGVTLTNDPARAPATAPANANMTNAFAQGVLRFRQLYPFYSPSQMTFISTDYGIDGWTNTWANTAVFSTNAGAGLAGVTALNDTGREEWFSKIYGLTGVDSLNFRCYVVAQLTDANGNPRGAPHRKYYQIYTAPNPAALTNAALPPFRPVVVEEGSY